jgi:hypothetical protein
LADQQQGSDEVRLSARRRLIKGSFAAPAALMLFSGGAAAATSNTCVARAATSTATPQGFDTAIPSGTTGWLRVQASTYTKTDINKPPKISYFITYTNISAVVSAAGSKSGIMNNWIVTGQALCVESGEPKYKVDTLYGSGIGDGKLPDFTSSDRWYSVLVNENGQIIGIGTYTNGRAGNSVSQSCWNSFTK